MRDRPFGRRRKLLEQQAELARGSRVRYVGGTAPGVAKGAVGTIVSEVPSPMDVTPFATPPTVPEQVMGPEVEVEFDEAGRHEVALMDLVLDEA